jgi:SAM-dependent methyltransferase
MQNYVYTSKQDSLNIHLGSFFLKTCAGCGFSFNADFNTDLIHYDAGYNNNNPASYMVTYYKQIAAYLYNKYRLEGKLVVDIGCGKGNFITTLCTQHGGVRGLGVDPSYEPGNRPAIANLRFVNACFSRRHIDEQPGLLVCRHVLEHLEQPLNFLAEVRSAIAKYPDTPMFLEVPDLDWITANNAFWDFVYEHCNYFTKPSLAQVVARAGFRPPSSLKNAYQGQYIWLETDGVASAAPAAPLPGDSKEAVARGREYAKREHLIMENANALLSELAKAGRRIVVWGVGAKGALFTFLISRQAQLVHYCVDINKDKHYAYVPGCPQQILPPNALPRDTPLTILVMNGNYLAEIQRQCAELGLDATFLVADHAFQQPQRQGRAQSSSHDAV